MAICYHASLLLVIFARREPDFQDQEHRIIFALLYIQKQDEKSFACRLPYLKMVSRKGELTLDMV